MNLEERYELFGVLRHQLSAILSRRIASIPDKARRDALVTQLNDVRALFLVPPNIKASTFEAKWTPKYAEDVFTAYGALLQAIGAPGTAIREVGDELIKVLPVNQQTTPDSCSRLDRLLEANVGGLWFKAAEEYFTWYREDITSRQNAAEATRRSEDFLASQLGETYRHSRALAGDNDDVLGALVEGKFREIVRGLVAPLHVSSGGVAGLPHMKQIDTIIWSRQHGPAAIEVEGVAIVPPAAVRGLVEVKASFDPKLHEFGLRVGELMAEQSAMQNVWKLGSSARAFGVLIWSDLAPNEVRARTAGAARSLFHRKETKLVPNPEGLGSFLAFLRKDVLGVYTGSTA